MFVKTTQRSNVREVIFCIISLLVLDATANCNNDKCLKSFNSDLALASSFCSTYTTNMAISTPSAINSGCKSSSSKILSACSCINTATSTAETTITSLTSTKPSSSSHTTSISASATASRSMSTSNAAIPPATVTVTLVQSITISQAPRTATLLPQTVTAGATCTAIPCSLYEGAIPSCILGVIQGDFGAFQPNCFGIGLGPDFVKSCICPFLSQLPALLQSPGVTGLCPGADLTAALAYQRSECLCLGATIG